MIIGVDVGSTHCKVALVDLAGTLQRIETASMVVHRDVEGGSYYNPDEVWETVVHLLTSVVSYASSNRLNIEAVGVASMAESGVLVSGSTGQAYSNIIPWFDQRAACCLPLITGSDSDTALFTRTGLYPNAKHGLTKLLWLRNRLGEIPGDAVWLSTADFVVYRLTGVMATDYTLAARTLAFDIRSRTWDEPWIANFGLAANLFPKAMPSGTPAGTLLPVYASRLGLSGSISVSVTGHDHLCSMVGAGLSGDDSVLNSVGTAETLLGVTPLRELGEREFETGLVYGLHVTGDSMYWLGSLPMSGGSVDWARRLLLGEAASYDDLKDFMRQMTDTPRNLIYVPPLPSPGAVPETLRHGSFFGLTLALHQTDIFQAVLEGLSLEVEFIRRRAERALGKNIHEFAAVGGGARNASWLQVKANVTGCIIDVLETTESTVVGAALVAARGAKLDVSTRPANVATATRVVPDAELHQAYQQIYETKYLPLRNLVQSGVST